MALGSAKVGSARHVGPRHLLQADFSAAAEVLTRSFRDDPVVRWILGVDDDRFPAAGTGFFSALVPRSHRRGHAYVIEKAGVMAGAALWSPPEVPMFGQDDGSAIRDALLEASGEAALARLGAVGQAMGAHHPEQPYFYLGTVGIDPSAQGHGLGEVLLRPILDRCDHDGLASYLESSNPRNVRFYERIGYEVIFHEVIDDGVSLEGMWRTPRPSR